MQEAWTGADATALRKALRLSQREFAEKTDISLSVVKKWASRGETVTLPPEFAEMMNTHLEWLRTIEGERFDTGLSERTGLRRAAVVRVLGYESNTFPDHELFMTIAQDLVDEPYLAAWSAIWQTAHDSPNRDIHPPV
ncbi:helix-turn-helix domain-containing protein [Nocardia sp. NPDC059091]|uniref:helix-turn-helix domain-containing protein n=1 Tax=unclassified Nocardia TaxID=2637762 RepID=UPI0036CAE7F4